MWWLFGSYALGLVQALRTLPRCFVAARTTKHLNFSAMPTDYVFTDATCVLTTARWDIFAVVQSNLHEVWARKFSSSLKTWLRYSPSNSFVTFAFPAGLWQASNSALAAIGERYHAQRKEVMQLLWLGLTKIYNLFHAHDLSLDMVTKASKKDADTVSAGLEATAKLRQLHVELNCAVRDAYGWRDLDLEHGFHEIETLPENDRVQYTISPAARFEVIRRLHAENKARALAEAQQPKPLPVREQRKIAPSRPDLFSNKT